jgi:phosphoribosylformimino-5-aminoimidazole carboxamide ribotide isomerase
MILFPAIDLREGQCVRLFQGDYEQTTIYSSSPLEVAESFLEAGAEWIHVVDLDGAKSGSPQNLEIIHEIKQTGLKVQTGGGYRSIEMIEQTLNRGIDRVILGSAIVKSESLRKNAAQFGSKIVAGLDVRDEKIAISGWQEQTSLGLFEFAHELEGLGYSRIIVTDIATDGAFTGPNLALAQRVMEQVGMNYIISGGVSNLQDLKDAAQTNAEGIIVGKAIYEKRLNLLDCFNKSETQLQNSQ